MRSLSSAHSAAMRRARSDGIRRVRTREGARRYGVPIGTPLSEAKAKQATRAERGGQAGKNAAGPPPGLARTARERVDDPSVGYGFGERRSHWDHPESADPDWTASKDHRLSGEYAKAREQLRSMRLPDDEIEEELGATPEEWAARRDRDELHREVNRLRQAAAQSENRARPERRESQDEGIAPPDERYKEVADQFWSSLQVYGHVDSIRDEARRIQRDGYATDDDTDDDGEFDASWIDDDDLLARHVAGQFVADATHANPTSEPIFRGMRVSDAQLGDYRRGRSFSMGLSSFASRENAIDYATDPSQEGAAVKISGHRPLILELEAGARVATLGTGSERVAFGRFEVVSRSTSNGVTRVKVRQTSLSEA